jgi:hypothetical protein
MYESGRILRERIIEATATTLGMRLRTDLVIDPDRAATPASCGSACTHTRRACLPHSRALQCDEKAVTMRGNIMIVDDDKDAARPRELANGRPEPCRARA